MKLKFYKSLVKEELPFLAGVPAFIWQLLFFYVPLLFILYLSFRRPEIAGFSFANYRELADFVYVKIIWRSLLLALTNGILCLCAAFPLAYFLVFKAGRLKIVFLFLLIVPFWTNFLLHIYAWFYVLERNGFLNMLLYKLGIIQEPLQILNSIWAILLGMFYSYLPFMVFPIYSALDRFDVRLLEASADLGAHTAQTFYKVLVPLILPGILTGFFLVFVPSFSEFAIPALMGGDRTMFAGTLITYLFLNGYDQPLGAAFALVSSTLIIGGAFMVYKFIIKKLVL